MYLNENVLRASIIYALEAGRGCNKREYLQYFKELGFTDTFTITGSLLTDNIHFISILGTEDRKQDLIKFLDILPNKPRHSYLTNIVEGIKNNESNEEIEKYIKLYPLVIFALPFIHNFQSIPSSKETTMQTSSNQLFSLQIQFTDTLTSKEKRLLIIGFLGEALVKIGKDEYRYNNQKVDFDERFNNGILLIQDKKKVTFIKTDSGFEIVTEHEGAKKFWKLLSSLSAEMIQSYTLIALKPEEPEFF